jgi:hypothetical protein
LLEEAERLSIYQMAREHRTSTYYIKKWLREAGYKPKSESPRSTDLLFDRVKADIEGGYLAPEIVSRQDTSEMMIRTCARMLKVDLLEPARIKSRIDRLEACHTELPFLSYLSGDLLRYGVLRNWAIICQNEGRKDQAARARATAEEVYEGVLKTYKRESFTAHSAGQIQL